MKYYLCLEEKQITYICGRCGADGFVIKKAGCVDTGTEPLEESLSSFISSNGLMDKRMVVSGIYSEIICKEMHLPSASKRLTRQMIYNEIAYSRENSGALVADMDILRPRENKKERHVLAYAASRTQLEGKFGEFRQAGLHCERLLVLRDCMAKLACWYKNNPAAAVMVELDEHQVYLRLVKEGHCLLSRNIRLNVQHFCEENAMEFLYEELTDQIRKLMQFYSKRNEADTLKRIIMMPSRITSAEAAAEYIQDTLEIPVDCLDLQVRCAKGTGPLDLSVYGRVLAVCAADQQFKRRDTPDLLRARNLAMLSGNGLFTVGRGARLLLLAGVNAAAVMGLWLYTRADMLDTMGMIRENSEFMQEGDRQEQYQQYLEQQKNASARGDVEQDMKRQEWRLRNIKCLSMTDYDTIVNCLDEDMSLESMAYSSQTGTLDMTISMSGPESAPELVEQIRLSEHFPGVSHSLWRYEADVWENDRIYLDISSMLNPKGDGNGKTQ